MEILKLTETSLNKRGSFFSTLFRIFTILGIAGLVNTYTIPSLIFFCILFYLLIIYDIEFWLFSPLKGAISKKEINNLINKRSNQLTKDAEKLLAVLFSSIKLERLAISVLFLETYKKFLMSVLVASDSCICFRDDLHIFFFGLRVASPTR